jgi:hypothetical protein
MMVFLGSFPKIRYFQGLEMTILSVFEPGFQITASANPTDRAMPSHPFGKWWQIFFTYKAVQNPYRRILIFMAVYKGRQEIRRIPESASPYKIRGKARFILSRSCNCWSWLTNVRKVCWGYIYLLKIFYLLRS